MSDLPQGSADYGRGANAPNAGGMPSPQAQSSGMRTPRDIMNQRQAREAQREARKRAEAEAAAEADQQRIRQREAGRTSSDKRAGPPVVTSVPRDSGYRSAGAYSAERSTFGSPYTTGDPSGAQLSPGHGRDDASTSLNQRVDDQYAPRRGSAAATNNAGFSGTTNQSRTYNETQFSPAATTQHTSAPPAARTAASVTSPAAPQSTRFATVPPVIAPPPPLGTQPRTNPSAYPHAFERWETLSSHWEGLTSYWIRRLELNSDEIREDITMAQLSRQVTDLSAAGANLFHAVVELQRLRASSDRKFQRWFFETRAQQERDQEEIGRLQDELDAERQSGRASATRMAMDNRMQEINTSYLEIDRHNAELRRELQIAKEEARRAWEELGRKEQEERDRQLALREGHPISIGGVQVQPMQTGSVSRGPSQREASYHGHMGHGSLGHGEIDYGVYEQQQPSPTNTDPYTGSQPQSRPQTTGQYRPYNPEFAQSPLMDMPMRANFPQSDMSQTRSSQPGIMSGGQVMGQAITSRFYQQPETYIHQSPGVPSALEQSSGPYDRSGDIANYERDEQGNVRLDAEGRPIRRSYLSGVTSSTRYSRQSEAPTEDDDEYDEGELPTFQAAEQVAQYGRVHTRSASGASSKSNATATPIIAVLGPSQARTPHAAAESEGEGLTAGGGPGPGSGWELQSRFAHNARLSDVLEEEDDGRGSRAGVQRPGTSE